jgi:hypothetical protein
MEMIHFKIVNPGTQTITHDLRRFGWYRNRYAVIGRDGSAFVASRQSAKRMRSGNHPHWTGHRIQPDAIFAVTGARFDLRLNGIKVPMWVAHRATRGDRLSAMLNKASTPIYALPAELT